MNEELSRLLLGLQVLRSGWGRGVPIRPVQFQEQLQAVLRLVALEPESARSVYQQLQPLNAALLEAQTTNAAEVADLPRRRRAVRAHACLRQTESQQLRRRA